jgi:CTP:molybdopterin cytidylyltransferase MocA
VQAPRLRPPSLLAFPPMTIAAVILAASPQSALADADGLPAVRRNADVAWSGGAVPIVVVAADADGQVASALAGAPVTLAEPAPQDRGPAGQIARGFEVATAEIHETEGWLVWPARLTWVGPETVTSLIEVHGTSRDAILAPVYDGERGWPILVPAFLLSALRTVAPDRMPDEIIDDLVAGGARIRLLELGDPGTTHDVSTPSSALPPYVGPGEPLAGHVHEWGEAIAEMPEDAPLEGPALAPYGQAVAGDPDQPG